MKRPPAVPSVLMRNPWFAALLPAIVPLYPVARLPEGAAPLFVRSLRAPMPGSTESVATRVHSK